MNKRDRAALEKLIDEGRACERRIEAAFNYEEPQWLVTYSYVSPGIAKRMSRTIQIEAIDTAAATTIGLARVPSYASDGRVDAVVRA